MEVLAAGAEELARALRSIPCLWRERNEEPGVELLSDDGAETTDRRSSAAFFWMCLHWCQKEEHQTRKTAFGYDLTLHWRIMICTVCGQKNVLKNCTWAKQSVNRTCTRGLTISYQELAMILCSLSNSCRIRVCSLCKAARKGVQSTWSQTKQRPLNPLNLFCCKAGI